MHHLTLNNGHTRWSSREEVEPEVLGLLAPMARSGRHPIPETDCHVTVTRIDGAAAFTVEAPPLPGLPAAPNAPLVTCGVVWKPHNEAVTWELIEQLYRRISEAGGGVMLAGGKLSANPPMPAKLPWLAVVVLSGLVLYPQHGHWLGDFERCLAWTIVEHSPA